jgi:glycosyltransferase 2 family protein
LLNSDESPNESSFEPPVNKKPTAKTILAICGIIISVLAVIYIAHKIDIKKSLAVIRNIDPWLTALMIVTYLAGFVIRGIRWKAMLRNVTDLSFRTSIKAIILGYAGNNVLPARGGELVRMEFISRQAHLSRVASLTSIMAERLFDGVAILTLFAVALIASGINFVAIPWLKNTLIYGGLLFFGGVIVLMIISSHLAAIRKLLSRWLANSKHLPKLLSILNRIDDALKFVSSGKRLWLIIVLSLSTWLIEGLVFKFGLMNLGLNASWPIAYFTMAVVNLGLLVPSSPAFIGVFHGMCILAVGMFAISPENGLSLGILVHAVMVVPITLIGAGILMKQSFAPSKSAKKDVAIPR